MRKVRSTTEVGSSVCEHFAALRNEYDAARPSIYRRARVGASTGGASADYHYRSEAGYFAMMELARELFRNHTLIGQGVRRLVANIVQGGFIPDPDTGDAKIDDALLEDWQAWSTDKKRCEIQGELTFNDVEDLVLQHTVVDGDVIEILPPDGDSLQLLEAHRLRTPTGTDRNVVHGVLLDEYRRRLEYWITKEDVSLSAAVRRVGEVQRFKTFDPSGNRQVLHLYRPDRVSQTRGVTAFAPPADTAGMGDDLCFSQLVKAQHASCYAIFHELSADADPMGPMPQRGELSTETRPDGSTRRIEGMGPGTEIYGYRGETLKGFSPNIPNQEFFQHIELILTILAVNLDLPLMVFILDPSKTSYTAWRGAMDQAKLRFRKFQGWLAGHHHSEIWKWRVRRKMATDAALRRAFDRYGDRIFRHTWNPPTWPYIEPLKDVSADLLAERSALNSPRRIQAANGRDFWKVTDEIVEDNVYRITAAKKAAAKLNAKFKDGQPVHWREIMSLPSPEGVSLNVDASAESDGGSGKRSNGGTTDGQQ